MANSPDRDTSVPVLTVSREETPGFLRLRLAGRLDSLGCLEQGQAMVDALEETEVLVLNMAELKFLASAGMRILLELAKRAKAKDKGVRLESVPPFLREVLNMSGMGRMFAFVQDTNA